MKVAETVNEVREFLKTHKSTGQTTGLVPTMGALHEGHLSLIRQAKKENDLVVVSIFVNPTQFGPDEDFDLYPRVFDDDLLKCKDAGVDLVFHPAPEEMYTQHKTYIQVEDLSRKLCGVSRPIHFRGVCTIVAKLFNITHPDRAYFGQKDAQQLLIIKKMVKDLNFDVDIVGCPIIREEDGLAKSSRNRYLNDQERKDATVLYRAIEEGKHLIRKDMTATDLTHAMEAVIKTVPSARIDYLEVVDMDTLEAVETIDRDVLVAMAVYLGSARLIDNFIYSVSHE
ncbi:pantoate--beta-alanine ligase [Cutibacterium sp.]|uniref:pantoate--beta-alanine ligase n=1 Tax=Cutibacterium sp. TaxID=1912221 RepID=UPI0026DC0884|nr:pantoate--beta-alanine ligase [Cutibacterium sp.]MDO4412318.1 pantoate--beta-alanine ligase [Cutibacterium sp.]